MKKTITFILLIIINSSFAQQRLDSGITPHNTYRMVMNYDNDNCLSLIEQFRDNENDPWEGNAGIYCSYDNNGVIQSKTIREGENYRSKTTFTYVNNVISEITLYEYDWFNEQWVQSGTGNYTYDIDGNLIEVLVSKTDVILSSGESLSTEGMEKEEYTFDTDNLKTSYKRFIKNVSTNNEWELIIEENYTYQNGKLILIEKNNNYRTELTYTSDGNIFEKVMLYLDNSTWTFSEKYKYTYDTNIFENELLLPNHYILHYLFGDNYYTFNNKITSYSHYEWNNSDNDWTYVGVLNLQYSDVTSVSDINSGNYIVYPNPTTDLVKFEVNKLDSIEIYNLNGKLITKTDNNIVDMKGLSSGIYLYKIHNGNEVINGKIIKK